jgi:hypothetical protein
MNKLLVTIGCSIGILCAHDAISAAGLKIIEPDAFATGTDISNAFPGVTLSALGQANQSVFSLSSSPTSTGTRVFGNSEDGHEWGNGFNQGMRVDFTAPTDYVQIDIIGNDSSDTGRLLAFNAGGTLLDTFTTGNLALGAVAVASIARASTDIAWVIATGSANEFDSISLDNLQFGRIPEPATGLLLLAGASAWLARRRGR